QGGDALEGTQPVGGVVDHGGDHQLVGLAGVDEIGDAALDGLRRADDLGGQAVVDERAFQLVVGVSGRLLGEGIGPGRPERSRRNDSAPEPARKRARSSVSAHTTAAATIAYGRSRTSDGRKCWRYRASAGSVLAALK